MPGSLRVLPVLRKKLSLLCVPRANLHQTDGVLSSSQELFDFFWVCCTVHYLVLTEPNAAFHHIERQNVVMEWLTLRVAAWHAENLQHLSIRQHSQVYNNTCTKSSLRSRRCGCPWNDGSNDSNGREPFRQFPVNRSSSIVCTVHNNENELFATDQQLTIHNVKLHRWS